ncbi:DUF3841 domain-containing protein [Oscillibacter sp.]|uniref:DUF3841 domain-containing protein n=1 Tax=Oscillibacter sp. TaxID=1945593 RepID=UPI0028A18EC5|nr:DUF3841 domain-containing protein [Oscillibacter sp.]
MNTVRLYTRQSDKTLLMLEHGGRIVNQRIYVQLHFGDMAGHYLDCYDWFAREASRFVPRPEGAELSIWCTPNVKNCLPPIEGTVVYALDVPEDRIVFFDDAKWDYVLNHRYLPLDDADEAAYRKHLQNISVANSFEFFEGRYAGKYPEETTRILESWKRVFDPIDHASPTACGNVWEIRREQIVRVFRPGETVASV